MRLAGAVISLVLLGATLSPVLREPYDDGFPLSTYPMFASKRPTTWTMHYALGQGRAGERVVLRPSLVGTGEVLQAMRVIDRAVGSGRTEQQRLCTAIAGRVATEADYAHVVNVRIVTGTHGALDYLVRDQIGRETERVRCAVTR